MAKRNDVQRFLAGLCGVAAATACWAGPGAEQDASAQRSGNRIEVTGNRASGIQVHCDAPAQVNVNSVTIDGRALQGETVVVTGRNTQDVRVTGDCEPASEAAQPRGNVQINSVNIR